MDNLWSQIESKQKNGLLSERSAQRGPKGEFYRNERATILILDRLFDTQTPLTYDYSYQTQIFEILKNLPPDLCVDDESFMKDIIAQQGADAPKNYLNETDFFMSKYKSASIQEVAQMFKKELTQLKE